MKIVRKVKSVNQFVLILFCLTTFKLNSQIITSGKLTYELEVVLGDNRKGKLEENKAGSDKTNDIDHLEKITAFLDKHGVEIEANSSNRIERWTYQFDSNQARIIGNKKFKGETFDLYLFDEMIRIIRRHHKENIKDIRIDTMNYQKIKADREYQVQINKDSIRQIGEYECYEIVVEEVRELGETELRISHKLYVTEEIKFSPSIILEWGERITDDCPIYIKSWIKDETRSYNEYRLVGFEEEIDQRLFEVPEKFKN